MFDDFTDSDADELEVSHHRRSGSRRWNTRHRRPPSPPPIYSYSPSPPRYYHHHRDNIISPQLLSQYYYRPSSSPSVSSPTSSDFLHRSVSSHHHDPYFFNHDHQSQNHQSLTLSSSHRHHSQQTQSHNIHKSHQRDPQITHYHHHDFLDYQQYYHHHDYSHVNLHKTNSSKHKFGNRSKKIQKPTHNTHSPELDLYVTGLTEYPRSRNPRRTPRSGDPFDHQWQPHLPFEITSSFDLRGEFGYASQHTSATTQLGFTSADDDGQTFQICGDATATTTRGMFDGNVLVNGAESYEQIPIAVETLSEKLTPVVVPIVAMDFDSSDGGGNHYLPPTREDNDDTFDHCVGSAEQSRSRVVTSTEISMSTVVLNSYGDSFVLPTENDKAKQNVLGVQLEVKDEIKSIQLPNMNPMVIPEPIIKSQHSGTNFSVQLKPKPSLKGKPMTLSNVIQFVTDWFDYEESLDNSCDSLVIKDGNCGIIVPNENNDQVVVEELNSVDSGTMMNTFLDSKCDLKCLLDENIGGEECTARVQGGDIADVIKCLETIQSLIQAEENALGDLQFDESKIKDMISSSQLRSLIFYVGLVGIGFMDCLAVNEKNRQWLIAWPFPLFRWSVPLVPLWRWDERRRYFSVGVFHAHKFKRSWIQVVGTIAVRVEFCPRCLQPLT